MLINNKPVMFADVSDEFDTEQIVRAMTKVMDKFASVRRIVSQEETESKNDVWATFVDRLAEANSTTSAAILSKRRTPPLPELRAIAAASWQQSTEERITRIAPRLNMDYSSVITAINKLDEKSKKDEVLRERYCEGVFICEKTVAENGK